MIICDYIDENVKNYLRGKSNNKIITFFKEPFNSYRGNEIIFIDDILNEGDYKKIDEFTKKIILITKKIFSKYLHVNDYNLFDYSKLQAQRNLSKIYKFKYSIDKILKRENKIAIYFFCSETELFEWLKQEYKIENINNHQSSYKFKIKKYLKNYFLQITYSIRSL